METSSFQTGLKSLLKSPRRRECELGQDKLMEDKNCEDMYF